MSQGNEAENFCYVFGENVFILLWTNYFSLGQRITSLEKNHKECREDRIKKEEEFCDRITDVEIAQAYQKSLNNGAKP